MRGGVIKTQKHKNINTKIQKYKNKKHEKYNKNIITVFLLLEVKL
jgi:hypothetical protein